MSKLKIFLMLTGYQITWLMCVFGEIILKSFLPGIISGLIFLFLVAFFSKNIKKLIFITIFISIIGYTFDSFLVSLKIYNFESSMHIGWLPIWMIVLWPSFATLFDEVFNFLFNYKIIAILLSGVLGPLTYYSGSPLGLISINQLNLFLFFMVIFWILLMFFYLNFLLGKKLS